MYDYKWVPCMTTDTDAINAKLDEMFGAKGVHIFNDVEIDKLRTGMKFVDAFDGDPATLMRVASAFRAAEGWVTVTKKAGLVIAFGVILWANWGQLLGLIRGERP